MVRTFQSLVVSELDETRIWERNGVWLMNLEHSRAIKQYCNHDEVSLDVDRININSDQHPR